MTAVGKRSKYSPMNFLNNSSRVFSLLCFLLSSLFLAGPTQAQSAKRKIPMSLSSLLMILATGIWALQSQENAHTQWQDNGRRSFRHGSTIWSQISRKSTILYNEHLEIVEELQALLEETMMVRVTEGGGN